MLNDKMEAYAAGCLEDLKKMIRELAVIPAPSHSEDRRAAYIRRFLARHGVTGVRTDEAKNVIWSFHDTGVNDLAVMMAHTDVVFPDTTPLPLIEEEDRYRCPGITDDVAPLCILLISALYFHQNGLRPRHGLLIVADSCEEGLGNLEGSRRIVDAYGPRIKEFITVEADRNRITDRAVGSRRYQVTVETEGGHSYGCFGKRNAIQCLASIIEALYAIPVPEKPGTKTTYNVGVISGGTSVNTIAQQAQMLFEFRSDDEECLARMEQAFSAVIAAHRSGDARVAVRLLGERPCGHILSEKLHPLEDKVARCIRETLHEQPEFRSASTDANYPLSKGIPAVCMGSVEGYGCHTRQEYLLLSELQPAVRMVMDVMSTYF
ncbi:MAG: M20/M25/M40 family metallo-hydrolase [Clostridia bacterium]|nr:M20/M25/M40 family metallo-hydrolase [Clostridia bacterium]